MAKTAGSEEFTNGIKEAHKKVTLCNTVTTTAAIIITIIITTTTTASPHPCAIIVSLIDAFDRLWGLLLVIRCSQISPM